MKMYRSFVEGESIQVVERDGAWSWNPWAYTSQSRSVPTASAAALDALAYLASQSQPSESVLADALAGIVETARTTTPELIRAADLVSRMRSGVDGGLATRQRWVLRLFHIGHADAVLMERWNPFAEQETTFMLVETRPGALPPPGERPDCIDGFAVHYEDAAPAGVRTGTLELQVIQAGNYGYQVRDGQNAVLHSGSGNPATGSRAAVDLALDQGAAQVVLRGNWLHDAAVVYGRVKGIGVELGIPD